MYYWIQFANSLLIIFAFIFPRDVGLWFSFKRQREGDTERLTDGKPGTDTGEKMASDLRQTHWHRPWHTSERDHVEEAVSPREGGISFGPGPAGRSALGLTITRGVPKTSSQPRSQMSPLAWLPKARRNPRPQARGCVRVCVWVCWWARVWSGWLRARWIPRMEAGGCGGPGLGSLCSPLAGSLYFFLCLS